MYSSSWPIIQYLGLHSYLRGSLYGCLSWEACLSPFKIFSLFVPYYCSPFHYFLTVFASAIFFTCLNQFSCFDLFPILSNLGLHLWFWKTSFLLVILFCHIVVTSDTCITHCNVLNFYTHCSVLQVCETLLSHITQYYKPYYVWLFYCYWEYWVLGVCEGGLLQLQ